MGVPDIVRRRLGRPARPDGAFWLAALIVTLIGAALRFRNLAYPPGKIFDEVYYADQGWDLLNRGVEWDTEHNSPERVVHPPLGKWMIAVGEHVFGYNEFGWRISAAVIGTLSILLVIVIAQRLFGSSVLACAAGLLLALDGMHFVLSRVALLDIFLMFFVVAGFGCLLLDREQRRERRLWWLEHDSGAAKLGVPWWRLAAGVSLGLACAVKWSGIWYVLLFVVLVVLWEAGARRSVGVRRAWRQAIHQEWPSIVGSLVLASVVYIVSWSGWFASDDGYLRHWYADSHQTAPGGVVDAVASWVYYHVDSLRFHTTLTVRHTYQSWPWQWLLLARPVLLYWTKTDSCGQPDCVEDVLMLGTPLLWWSFLPALLAAGWLGIARRDWRVTAIGACALAGILPWFWSELDNRTMYAFYALPAEPFLVLAVVYVLGAVIGPAATTWHTDHRRITGAVIAGGYVLVIAVCFAYFSPIYTATPIPYNEWLARMWLGNRWI